MSGKRPAGDGLVRKRGDKRWEGRIIIGHKEDGSPIYKSVFAKTQKELMPKLHALINEYRGLEMTDSGSITLNEWMERWMTEYAEPTLRPSTKRSYRKIIEIHISPALGKKLLRSITQRDIQRFYNGLKDKDRQHKVHGETKKLADSYVRGTHMLLHEIFEAAVSAQIIPKNPTNGTTVPKCNYQSMKIFTEDELAIFMEAIKEEPEWYDFFYTEMTTGMRRGEICALKWDDLDESSGRLSIKRSVSWAAGVGLEIGETKTNKGKRTILLPPSTLNLLKERKKNSDSEWIFPDLLDKTKPISPASAYKKLKVILKRISEQL